MKERIHPITKKSDNCGELEGLLPLGQSGTGLHIQAQRMMV